MLALPWHACSMQRNGCARHNLLPSSHNYSLYLPGQILHRQAVEFTLLIAKDEDVRFEVNASFSALRGLFFLSHCSLNTKVDNIAVPVYLFPASLPEISGKEGTIPPFRADPKAGTSLNH